MDNRKKNAITGIILGLIGFILLFYFNFERWEFSSSWRYRGSLMGGVIFEIIKTMRGGWIDSSTRSISENTWWIFQPIFILLAWYYRACIGHWFYKIIEKFYKKI